jgi:ribonuclease P protein component
MIPRTKRVSKEAFSKTFKNSRFFSTPYFSFKVTQDTLSPHFSCVVSKSVAKQAVLRNSLRRKWYNAFAKLPITKGTYLIFLKKEAISLSFSQIQKATQAII